MANGIIPSATPGAPAPATPTPQQQVENAYWQLYQLLRQAYPSANDTASIQIAGMENDCLNIISQLNVIDIVNRTSDFSKLSDVVASVNQTLTALKASINATIADVGLATKVANAIDQVITLAAKYLK